MIYPITPFGIIGNLDDGRQQEVDIVFAWAENEEDYKSGGIRSGLDTDGDRRANSVDEDDDNDGVDDSSDDCSTGETRWMSNPSTDNDGDGCRDDSSEDLDDDNDGLADSSDDCSTGETRWMSNLSTDNDGDGCRDDSSEDTDDDNDGLDDNHAREKQSVGGKSCSLLADCDGDSIRDIDEAAADCVIKPDCDGDTVGDEDEAAGCIEKTDCDNDGTRDDADIDDDGDGLIEIATHEELDRVRYALNGDGRGSSGGGALDTRGCSGSGGTRTCNGYELVADISLAGYSNWQPLGHDTDGSEPRCQGAAFNGTFEGNGWTISDLNINRPNEDCVGLFGHTEVIDANPEIRNIRLHSEAVIGKTFVGGLVGSGNSVRIHSSLVVAGEVSGTGSVGGLVGSGRQARIHSSSVVVDEVRGTASNIGGLIGSGFSARIYSSLVVVDGMIGSDTVGGLIGWGNSAQIFSSSVVVGEMSGSTSIGSLTGSFSISSRVAYSYVVSGSDTAMLVGSGGGTGVTSYWDSDTSGITTSDGRGEAKTSGELRGPTGYTDIYADWNDATDIFGDGMIDEPLAVWCDRDNSGSIEMGERNPGNLIWDFGESDEYPAIRCTPIRPDDWRSWWSLNEEGKPQLNQTCLDEVLNQ